MNSEVNCRVAMLLRSNKSVTIATSRYYKDYMCLPKTLSYYDNSRRTFLITFLDDYFVMMRTRS
jgi:hypothetical protein